MERVNNGTARATSQPPNSDVQQHEPAKSAVAPRKPYITTGFCYDPVMLLHRPFKEDPNDRHPEQPMRIGMIWQTLRGAQDFIQASMYSPYKTSLEERSYAHPFRESMGKGLGDSVLSLFLNRETGLCARMSCGGVIETCRAVADGRIRNAFAIVRPPGHHAEPEQEMGFCFFNNAAVAAQWIKLMYADLGIKRVMILDWDVHHGNGSQKAFWTDPDILYMSIHQYQDGAFYPGGPGGGLDQVGEGAGLGYNVNIPWSADGMGDADYLFAFQKVVMPIAYEFAPDFIIVSAGFDAAEGDELGRCKVTPAGYAHMTHMLSALASGRLVLALEGGYNLEAISKSALECVKVLLGDQPPKLAGMVASEQATEVMYQVANQQSQYWQSIKPTLGQSPAELSAKHNIVAMADILKAHRAKFLYYDAKLVNVELIDDYLQNLFPDQVFCSENVYTASTLVVFMHDMGVIRAETDAKECHLNVERSFLIDSTKPIIDWANLHNYGIIDVNVMSRSPSSNGHASRDKEVENERKLALHIWDNFVDISKATSVVFIGLCAGCDALTSVVNARSRPVRKKIKASVMLCGLQRPPTIVSDEEEPGMRNWYYDNSRVICPSTHDLMDERMKKLKRFGHLRDSGEARALDTLRKTWPSLQNFISQRLLVSKPPSRLNGLAL